LSLTPQQRAALHARIVEERQRAAARATALAQDFDEIVTASADAVRDDEHDPEGATIAFERTQVATLLADTRALLHDLVAAETRLGLADAGRCESCGDGIPIQRLLARPTARTCVACAASAGRQTSR
jgi:DnaK suppressor protein